MAMCEQRQRIKTANFNQIVAIEDKKIKQDELEKFSADSDKVFNLLSEANERSDKLVILEKTII